MVEPSFLAETCTPSSFWPEADVIEPVSNWSAEAVLAAPTRTTPATLANNWHRKFVMMVLSSSLLLGNSPPCPPPHAGEGREGASGGLAQSNNAARRDRPMSLLHQSCG